MKRPFILPAVLLISLSLSSCYNNSGGGGTMMPNVSGSTGEVVVVLDKAKWDGQLGDKIREVFAAPVYGLPQSEPTFTLANVTPSAFGKIYMTHRNVMFFDVVPELAEAKATFKNNVYSDSQVVIYLEGPDDESLIKLVEQQGNAITEKINTAERDRWITYYKRSINTPTFSALKDIHKMIMYIPTSYVMDVNEKGFLWFSYETPMTTQAVLVHYFDNNGANYFNEDSIKAIRNQLTRTKVKGPVEGTWMKIEDRVPVTYRTFSFRGRNYAEMKGLWTLENGYMGGPFVTLVTRDEVNDRFVMVDGFVYAPKEEKRELLRQVEAVLFTVGFDIESSQVVVKAKKKD